MKKELIVQLHASFEQLVHREEESGVEFWLAGTCKRFSDMRRGDVLSRL